MVRLELESATRKNIIDTVDLFATVALALSRVRRLPLEP